MAKIYQGRSMRCFKILILLLTLAASLSVYAIEDDGKELTKAPINSLKVNHFAKHIAMPFELYFNFDYGKRYTQPILYFKPVVPIHINNDLDLVIRTIAPLYERTPTRDAQNQWYGHYVSGWGDLNPTFFITPARFDKVIFGLGPSISIPTATNSKYIGTGKWCIGPEMAFYYFGRDWVWGFLADNLWSFAGQSNRPPVNAFEFEPLVSYIFHKGWFIATNPTITANWKNPASQQWVVPVGIGGGRVIKYNTQPISISIYSYYNAIRPSHTGPNWQVELKVEWLFKPLFM